MSVFATCHANIIILNKIDNYFPCSPEFCFILEWKSWFPVADVPSLVVQRVNRLLVFFVRMGQ